MIVYPCAKINLGLNVVNKRIDGYHDLETVFYPVPLFDKLEIKRSNEPTSLELGGIPLDGKLEENLVIRAYNAVRQRYTIPCVSITLEKNIPSQAGMGGGSSDCAYMIKALNEMFGIGMSCCEMKEVAASLGADCPFFINPGPSFATGIGEKLKPIPLSLKGYWIVVVNPPIAVSTREAFSKVVPKHPKERCDYVVLGDIYEWRKKLSNDFENSVFRLYPVLERIKQNFYEQGAVYSSMSGSGSAIYGIFKNEPPTFDIHGKCYKMIL